MGLVSKSVGLYYIRCDNIRRRSLHIGGLLPVGRYKQQSPHRIHHSSETYIISSRDQTLTPVLLAI